MKSPPTIETMFRSEFWKESRVLARSIRLSAIATVSALVLLVAGRGGGGNTPPRSPANMLGSVAGTHPIDRNLRHAPGAVALGAKRPFDRDGVPYGDRYVCHCGSAVSRRALC